MEMNNITPHDLKPCPFCNEVPSLPCGAGTQYELCCDCGLAMSCVQISDLMTHDERMACPDLSIDNGFSYPKEYIDRARDFAIKAWNTRAELSALRALVEELMAWEADPDADNLTNHNWACAIEFCAHKIEQLIGGEK